FGLARNAKDVVQNQNGDMTGLDTVIFGHSLSNEGRVIQPHFDKKLPHVVFFNGEEKQVADYEDPRMLRIQDASAQRGPQMAALMTVVFKDNGDGKSSYTNMAAILSQSTTGELSVDQTITGQEVGKNGAPIAYREMGEQEEIYIYSREDTAQNKKHTLYRD